MALCTLSACQGVVPVVSVREAIRTGAWECREFDGTRPARQEAKVMVRVMVRVRGQG